MNDGPARRCYSILWAICALSLSGYLLALDKTPLAIMPAPAHITQGEGGFYIDGSFGIEVKGYDEPRLARARLRFLDILSKETGIPFKRETVTGRSHFIVQTAEPSAAVQQLGEDETYHLAISTTDVELKAPNPLGVLRGLQTFLQLVRINERGFSVPVVTIDDAARFPWRGLLIDSGHRFVPIAAVKRNLSSEAECLPLALRRRPGISYREQEVPAPSRKGIRRILLLPGRSARGR
jgi:hexosaminidase